LQAEGTDTQPAYPGNKIALFARSTGGHILYADVIEIIVGTTYLTPVRVTVISG
jgi:hypothetical protein